MTTLHESILTKSQSKTYGPKFYTERGQEYCIAAEVRYDDECGNGYNTFSITATIDVKSGNRWMDYSGGCCHDEIAKHFPELAPFIKWHLTSSNGPMHYIANTVYHAGDRDYNGLRKGETRQLKNGKTGELCWILEGDHKLEKYVDSPTKPLEYKPWLRVGEGKERQLDFARSSAVWPEATDEQLSVEPEQLKKALEARLPALLADFKAAIESLGFTY